MEPSFLFTLSLFICSYYFALEEHTSAAVVQTLDRIVASLRKELFALCFPLILTDNGHEFSDIEGMEHSIYGGQRTKLFFCNPNRSDQKARCETNHKFFLYIVPNGTSVDGFMHADITLATHHITSYIRKSLFGKSPFALAKAVLPENFFALLGLEEIPESNGSSNRVF